MSSIITHGGKALLSPSGKTINFDNLIEQANETTGLNSITLADAISDLCAGYGNQPMTDIGAFSNTAFWAWSNETKTLFIFGSGETKTNTDYQAYLSEVETLKIAEGITRLSISYMFNNATQLKTVYLPASFSNTNQYIFNGCSNIENVYYSGTLQQWCEIEFYRFSSCPIQTSTKNPKLYISGKKIVGDIIIPSGTTQIGSGAFANLTEITSISIPDTVTRIGSGTGDGYSFYNCSNLISINIPNTITEIQPRTFSGCNSLQHLVIPASVTSIGNHAFDNVGYDIELLGADIYLGTWSCYSYSKYLHFTNAYIQDNEISIIMANKNAFGTSTKAVFSSKEILDIAKISTNWSSHASKLYCEEDLL